MSDWQTRTERAQRQLRGEPVEPELEEIRRVLVIVGDQLICSWCGGDQLSLRSVAVVPEEIEPDAVTALVGCRECGVVFGVTFRETLTGIAVEVEEA